MFQAGESIQDELEGTCIRNVIKNINSRQKYRIVLNNTSFLLNQNIKLHVIYFFYNFLKAARAVKQRTSHLKSVSSPTEVITPPLTYGKSTKDTKEKQWKRVRLNRMLVDHLLREGMYDTAKMLSEELTISELTNVEVKENEPLKV